jgi:histidyl-tRNA synthetase
VIILGPDELEAGQIVLKSLKTGEQNAYLEGKAIETIKSG